MTETGTVIGGKYEILKEIGRGGMSVVYLAMDMHLNKQWAVKEIRIKGSGKNDEIIINSLLAEADLMKRLDHPALPRIVDIIDNGITIYIVMDYIEGESLDKILKRQGAQSEKDVTAWARQLCDVLGYLHSQDPPIIYRDMKPANVMLRPEGNIKIIDFGIAREYKENNFTDTTVLGTKGYSPPEQYSGQTDARSDIYALGMTMHHLLTGVDPRSKEPYMPVRMIKPYISEGMELIIDKCVQPAAESRYQSCTELLHDLEHPELITKGYRDRQIRKLRLFTASVILSVVFAATGIVSRIIASYKINSTYEAYISVSGASSLESRIESYEKAVSICPSRTEAYIKMLEAFEESGHFSKEENDRLQALYNANRGGFPKGSTDFAELNYRIGMMYFNYYTNDDGTEDFSARVQKAYSFFKTNYEDTDIKPDFKYKKLSDCYFFICSFYKKYIFDSASVDEASWEDYDGLLKDVSMILAEIQSINTANSHDKLVVFNGVFMLLYDQRTGLAQAGINEDRVLGLLDIIYERAGVLEVSKKQNISLKTEIVSKYKDYRESIKRTYQKCRDIKITEANEKVKGKSNGQ